MKKGLFISCAILFTFTLAAYGYMNWNNTVSDQMEAEKVAPVFFDNSFVSANTKSTDSDLLYKIDSRFLSTITKEELDNAKTIVDILPRKATQLIVSYSDVRVSILDETHTEIISQPGEDENLTTDQIELLKSVDYSTNIYIKADYSKMTGSNKYDNYYLTYFITVIPETEAVFTSGHEALIHYLRESSKEAAGVIEREYLKPGKVNFVVTKEGKIRDAKLTSTSGYPTVDEVLVDLISNMPESWEPARNAKGEKVDQELVFFFGLEGC